MNPRARRLRRQRRKNERDPFRHVEKTRAFREQEHAGVVRKRLGRQAHARLAARHARAVASQPLTGGALLSTMLQGKPIA